MINNNQFITECLVNSRSIGNTLIKSVLKIVIYCSQLTWIDGL